MLRTLLISSILVSFLDPAPAPAGALVDTWHRETLDSGALIAVARPATPNGGLVLLAHGYVPEDYPLSATFDPEMQPYQWLLEEGWTVASTSYRRNGLIIRDAIADMRDLHAAVTEQYGAMEPVLVFGGSMGGAVTLQLLERHPGEYDGALVMSNAMYLSETEEPAPLEHRPGVPVVLLTNRNEAEAPAAYRMAAGAANPLLKPVLFTTGREGHMKFSDGEYILAVRALTGWVETRKRPPLDGEITWAPHNPESDTTLHGSWAVSGVRTIDPVYGNFLTGYTAADFDRLGIARGDTFLLEAAGQEFEVLYGTTYSDVPVGEWVAFLDANGTFLFSKNFDRAAMTIGLDPDARVRVRAIGAEESGG